MYMYVKHVRSVDVDSLFYVPTIVGGSLFCDVFLSVLSSFAIILTRRSELVALF